MTDQERQVVNAIAQAIVSQPRSRATFCDDPDDPGMWDEDSNASWDLLPVAQAAIKAMQET